jgi:type I restriction enzyme S subunit
MMRYDSYKDSGIEVLGVVPNHWKSSKFKFHHIELDNRVGNEWGNYSLLSLTKRGVVLRDIDSGEGKFPESFDTYKSIEVGDIIFCLYDIEETPRTVGISTYSGMITGSYKVFKTLDILPEFTNYTFQVIDDVKGLKPYYTGLRNVVRPETFKSLPINVPPLSEQKQIVSFLDTKTSLIDSLIEKTKRKIELLKEKRTSLINEVVTKGLNLNVEMKDSGMEWIVEIPSHWGIEKMKYIFTEKRSTSNHNLNSGSISFGEVIYKDDESIPISTKESYQELLEGEFLINPLNLNYDLKSLRIGLSRINVVVSQGYIIVLNTSENQSEYLRFLLREFDVRHLKSLGNGVRQTISFKHLSNELLPVPPLSEQNEIVSYLDEHTQLIDKTISVEERRIELLKEYRQSLISEVVTGKIDVRVN